MKLRAAIQKLQDIDRKDARKIAGFTAVAVLTAGLLLNTWYQDVKKARENEMNPFAEILSLAQRPQRKMVDIGDRLFTIPTENGETSVSVSSIDKNGMELKLRTVIYDSEEATARMKIKYGEKKAVFGFPLAIVPSAPGVLDIIPLDRTAEKTSFLNGFENRRIYTGDDRAIRVTEDRKIYYGKDRRIWR
ncbi:MAG: hypothetical protein V1492_04140 [Candidatus Micrarchaeota archaeon]